MSKGSHIEIVPAILAPNFAQLQAQLQLMRGLAPLVQIDVVDGVFAPHKTWPYNDGSNFEKIVAGDEGMPLWEDFDFQFDLMVADPHTQIQRFIAAGAKSVVIHAGSGGVAEALESARAAEVESGIALLPDAHVDALDAYAGLFDFAQIMGIASVGSQGRPFDERAVALVSLLREKYPDLPLQVDGGVSINHARRLVRAGASRLVVGSALFTADDPAAAYKALYTEANLS